ncbi:type II toxin-antitoxin system RelE family toxin (plasmid) [Clostridium tyrobutyricum]|uniref:type II toxin-antitoxin system RelE family toxin n=1 Tax=Clostridium tyrobutyricum TaxID=1519 RepID=UPI0039F7277D
MDNKRFEVIFAAGAIKEYKKLDNSILGIVNKAIDDLEFRADEVGKPLKGNLYGCKEKKLRNEGIRIIFRIVDNRVNILRIVYILAIQKRERDTVFKIATKRNNKTEDLTENNLNSWKEISIDKNNK